jgi:hypothetical protein
MRVVLLIILLGNVSPDPAIKAEISLSIQAQYLAGLLWGFASTKTRRNTFRGGCRDLCGEEEDWDPSTWTRLLQKLLRIGQVGYRVSIFCPSRSLVEAYSLQVAGSCYLALTLATTVSLWRCRERANDDAETVL